MLRQLTCAVLAVALTACSPKAPATGDSPRPTADKVTPSGAPAEPVPAPDPREAALSTTVLQLLEHEHLLRTKVDDAVSREAFANYLDRLDGSKMFLLKSDRDALARYIDKIDDELRSGSLELAHEGSQIFASRVAVVDKWVAEILASPMNHNDEEFVEVDFEKIEPATTDEELRDRWRKQLELEVLERTAQMEARLEQSKPGAKKPDDDDDAAAMPASKIPPTAEGREAMARADLAKAYAGRFSRLRTPGPLDAADSLINAVTSVLDPHTTYLPPADKANFDIQMSGSVEGIGAVLRERDHYIEIVEIVPGGASWRQGGLATGDLILSVAAEGKEPVDTFDMKIDDVVKMIRGPKGTVVKLRVLKPDGSEQAIAITRDVVVIEEAYARGAVLTRKGQRPVGYIHLPSFYGGRNSQHTAAADVRRLLSELKAKKVSGVVLDIRQNGGGLLGDAVEMTGELIDQGPVVQVKDNRDRQETLKDDEAGTVFDGQLIVLVDRFSASASEILAGALQDYGRALIVGTGPTHGKGTVQTLADLDRATDKPMDLGVLKITIQQFFRVTGSSTQREGVTPDVLLPDPAGHIESGERELKHALAWSSVPAEKYTKLPPSWNKAELVQRSAARVAKQPVLAKVAATTALLKARRNDTRIPLARAAWETRRKTQRAALEAVQPDLKNAPPRLTVVSIEDPSAKHTPSANGKTDDKLSKWRDSLARDPWVEECVAILGDMAASGSPRLVGGSR
ncbi:MAG: carboxy terminal-processing peptidase [Kofleriaceae bacterium]